MEYLEAQLPCIPAMVGTGHEDDAERAAEKQGPAEEVPKSRQPPRRGDPDGTLALLCSYEG